jgi:UDP-2,3-diacylglucosamine pyrophosphatase LpxH
MEYKKEQILSLYNEEKNKTYVAQNYCEQNNIPYSDSIRRAISKIINSSDVEDNDLENTTNTETNQYKSELSNMPSAWSSDKNRFYTIEEYCDVYGLDKNSVKSSKLVSHNASHMVYNIAFFTDDEEAVLDVDNHLEEIIQKYINPVKILTDTSILLNTDFFDRLVFTDAHLGMDVQGKGGDPLYDGKWDTEEILKRLTTVVSHIKTYKSSRTLIIDDLGDFLDGLGGQTTRKGHELPQNMNDKEVFDLALLFKTSLIDSLIEDFDTIICNNVTNDNHAGVFSYFVSSAVKQLLEQRYPEKVFVNSIKRFMHHYSVGNHTFVLCHGKDIGENKFGFKPKLDAIQAEKIDQYCKEHKLYNGNFIEFSKGDSHQAIYDDTTSNDFSYYNYPAFSPPSNWVKTNFKNSKSGFNFFNINKTENIKISIPYWF